MAENHDEIYQVPDQNNEDDLEHLLSQGVRLTQPTQPGDSSHILSEIENASDGTEPHPGSDIQGALGLYAEAAQDMATATVELALGRHFACADFCNQATEKAAQAVSLLRFGRRSMYDHDLASLGALVGAPEAIQHEMRVLTPFHPDIFYADTPPEEADAVINAEQASSYIQSARKVMHWAKAIVLEV